VMSALGPITDSAAPPIQPQAEAPAQVGDGTSRARRALFGALG
jgi:hypothetical protein